jgi:hypothetical protein
MGRAAEILTTNLSVFGRGSDQLHFLIGEFIEVSLISVYLLKP